MSAILNITGPIFLIIGLGYVSVRAGLFDKSHTRALGRFVMYVALPALLFKALADRDLADIVHADYMVIYALASAAPLALMLWWQRRQGASHARTGTMAMGVSCPNSGFVGFPILLLLMPQVAPIVLALNMVVENFFTLPLTMAYSERKPSARGHWVHAIGRALKPLRTNPLFMAIVLGGAFAATGWQLPIAVGRSIEVLAQAAGGAALFAIGGGLVGLQIKGLRRPVASVMLGKLIVHPVVCAALVYWVWPLGDPMLSQAMVLSTAMPMLGVYPLLASRVGQEDLASAAMLATTVVSFFSLSLVIALLGLGAPTLGV